MASGQTVRVKRGEVGFILTATLYDSNSAKVDLSPVNGDEWTGAIEITRRGSKAQVIGGALVIDDDYVNAKGVVHYTFTEDDAWVRATEYDIEIRMLDPEGRVHKFPKKAGDVFATLIVMETKEENP